MKNSNQFAESFRGTQAGISGSMFFASAILSLIMVLAVVGCAPTNPNLEMPPEEQVKEIAFQVRVKKQELTVPKVDILFVIDNSESMDKYQEALAANIDKFAAAFDEKANVDFQIGVISSYDTTRTHSTIPGLVGLKKDEPDYLPNGTLRPLKDPAQPGVAFTGAQFIRRDENYARILSETLKIGVFDVTRGGTEIEELFSPVAAAVGGGLNPGFIRSDAQLAVIFLTDADDSSPGIGARDLFTTLVQAKGGNSALISSYAALALNENGNKQCIPDPGFVKKDQSGKEVWEAPNKILDFVKISNGRSYNRENNPNVFSLCDVAFGAHLADVGASIQEKASPEIRVGLPRTAQRDDATGFFKLEVRHQGKTLVQGKDYLLDPSGSAVIVENKESFGAPDGGDTIFEIKMIPVPYSDVLRGRGKPAN